MAIEYLEASDVARVLGISASTVLQLVEQKKLRAAARTRRGVRLFRPGDVERLKQEREARSGEKR